MDSDHVSQGWHVEGSIIGRNVRTLVGATSSKCEIATYSALHFILQSQFLKHFAKSAILIKFSWVLVPIRVPSSVAGSQGSSGPELDLT
jgi:hypothetical protein